MDNLEFKKICWTELKKRGFTKKGNNFYYATNEMVCNVYLQKSNFGKYYYINVYYTLGNYQNTKEYPKYDDFYSRLEVLKYDKGIPYMGASFEYEKMTKEEIEYYLVKGLDEHVMPPLIKGKQHIIDHFDEYRKTNPEKKAKLMAKLKGIDL